MGKMGRPLLGTERRVPIRTTIDARTLKAINASRAYEGEPLGAVLDRWARMIWPSAYKQEGK